MRYTATSKEQGQLPGNEIEVQELVGLDEAAERALWRFVTSIDLVALVNAPGHPVADRLPWRVTNPRAATLSNVSDGVVRLLDVGAALAARTYERDASLVLEVVDPLAPVGRHRPALNATADGATCTPTDRSADLTLPVAALGSVFLGAHDLRHVVIRTGVDEHTPRSLAAARVGLPHGARAVVLIALLARMRPQDAARTASRASRFSRWRWANSAR